MLNFNDYLEMVLESERDQLEVLEEGSELWIKCVSKIEYIENKLKN